MISLKLKRARRNFTLPVFVVIFVAVTISFLSGLLANWKSEGTKPYSAYLVCGIATFVGLIVSLVILRFLATDALQNQISRLWSKKRDLLISFVVALGGTIFILWLDDHLSFKQWRQNPGGLFAIVTGIITCAGLYLTWKSLRDFRQIITSFSELVDRVCHLIEHTHPDDMVRFMAWTPALGCLALPNREWNRLRKLLVESSHKVQITCLEEGDLKLWHRSFVGRVTDRSTSPLTWGDVEEASDRSEVIIRRYEDRSIDAHDIDLKPVRKRMDRLPGYYLFANQDKAIIVAPFFIQLPPDTFGRTEVGKRLPAVQTLGFETSDQTIIGMAHKVIETYRNNVSAASPFFKTGTGDITEIKEFLSKNIDAAPGPNLDDSMRLRYRLQIFPAMSGTFWLTDKSLEQLRSEISEDVLQKLVFLKDKRITGMDAFLRTIETVLGPEQFRAHKSSILYSAESCS